MQFYCYKHDKLVKIKKESTMYLTNNKSSNPQTYKPQKPNAAKNKKNKHGFTNKHTEDLYSDLNKIFTEWRTSSTMTKNTLDQEIKSVFDKCRNQEENQELFIKVKREFLELAKPYYKNTTNLSSLPDTAKKNMTASALVQKNHRERSTALYASNRENERKTFMRPKKKSAIPASNPTDFFIDTNTKEQLNIKNAPHDHDIENNKNDSSNTNNLFLVHESPIDSSDDEFNTDNDNKNKKTKQFNRPAKISYLMGPNVPTDNKPFTQYKINKRPMYDTSDDENNSGDESTSANESTSDDESTSANDIVNKNKKKYNTASGKLLGFHQDIENQNITVEQHMDSNYIDLNSTKFNSLKNPYNNFVKAYIEATTRKEELKEANTNKKPVKITKPQKKIIKQQKKNKELVVDSLNHVQNKMLDLAKEIETLFHTMDESTELLSIDDVDVLKEVKDILAQHSQNIYADSEQYVASFRFQPNSSIKGSSLGKIKKKTGGNKYDITLNTTSFDTDTINDSYGTIETAFDTIAEQFDTTKEKSQNMFSNFFNKK